MFTRCYLAHGCPQRPQKTLVHGLKRLWHPQRVSENWFASSDSQHDVYFVPQTHKKKDILKRRGNSRNSIWHIFSYILSGILTDLFTGIAGQRTGIFFSHTVLFTLQALRLSVHFTDSASPTSDDIKKNCYVHCLPGFHRRASTTQRPPDQDDTNNLPVVPHKAVAEVSE